jgi:hopanoid biosynthesis associated RND transporter like protein HpnN
MTPPPPSLAVRTLRRLAWAVYHYPRLFFYPQVVLFVLSIFYTVDKLEFSTSRNDLVGADKPYHRNFLQYKKQFQGQDDLVAVVESEDMEKNRQFIERLGRRLELETNLFTDVFYKGDLKLMGRKALLFVTNETLLVEMLQRLQDARPVLQSFSQVTNLNSLFREINRQFRTAGRERNAQTDAMIKSLPALARIANQAADCLDRSGSPPSPGVTALFDSSEEAEQGLYITFATNRMYLVTARALREDLNGTAVGRLRELVHATQAEVPGVNAGITGEPVLEVDEMAQSQKDTLVASIVSLVICALLFVFGYKETGRPIKATICLVVGLAYTLGFTTLVIGHLNILTITFFPILVGLAIDFGIHLVARYEEELRHGRTEWEAIDKAMVFTGQGIYTGCFTTAGAFLAMGLTDFRGIAEMGIISGGGLLICLVPMMTLLPVLLLRGRQNVLDHQPQAEVDRRARLERLWLERPGLVLGVTAALCAACAFHARKVNFDYNLLHLQTRGLPAVLFERKLIDGASKSVLYGAVITDSLQKAVALENRIECLPSVASVDSIANYLVEDQTRKLALIHDIKTQLAGIKFAELDPEPVNVSELRDSLRLLQAYLGLGAKVSQREGEATLSQELLLVRRAIGRLRQRLAGPDADQCSAKLTAFQHALLDDLQDTFAAIRDQDDRAPLRAEDLPPALRNRFVGAAGTNYLLQVNPKLDVWQRENQEIFLRELRTVDPAVTGTPVQLYEYTKLLKESYEQAALYALGAIVLLVAIHFRNFVCVVLALLPVALGSIWMVGWMGWYGIPFNPANIMTLPLVIGVGVTNGIHILNRFAEEQNPSILARSTGKAVLLSALTTIAGFGSLVPALHQGIASLGLVMAVGTATCMIAGLTFLPCLLNLLARRGWLERLTGLKSRQST